MPQKDEESPICLDTHTHTTKLTALSSRHSQSALEYMMSYGWAILIIVIVAAALWSFGVFNPSSSRSQSITGFAGLGSVQAACFNNGTLVMSMGDSTGLSINVTSINATSSLFSGQKVTMPNRIITPSGSSTFGINNTCPVTVGSSFSVSVIVTYKQISTALPGLQFSSGTISGTVVAPHMFLTVFSETGLPTGTRWNVTYNGVTNSSTLNTITFLASGTHSFSIPSRINNTGIYTYNYTASTKSGNLAAGSTGNILFTQNQTSRLIFVGNNSGGTNLITFFTSNASRKSAIKTCGQAPRGIAVTPNGKYVYVSCYNTNAVSIINATAGTFIKNITLLGNGFAAAINPAGDRAYVTSLNGNYFSTINVISQSLLTSLNVGYNTRGLAVTNNGKLAYIGTSNGTYKVLVVNLSSNALISATLPTPGLANSVVISPDQKYAIAGTTTISCTLINLSNNREIANITTAPSNCMDVIAITQNDMAYFSGQGSAFISIINISQRREVQNITGFTYGGSGVLSTDGRYVYATDLTANLVRIVAVSSNAIIGTLSVSGPVVVSEGLGSQGDG